MATVPRAVARAARGVPGIATLLRQRDAARVQRDDLRRRLETVQDRLAEVEERRDTLESELAAATDALREATERTASLERELAEAVPFARPSFASSLARVRRLRTTTVQEHGTRHPIWDLNAKTTGRALAQRLGVDVPELIAGPAHYTELELDLSRPVVVKPVGGSTSRGVLPLTPRGSRAWYVFGREDLDEQGVRERMAQAAADPRLSEAFLVEELVASTQPDRILPHDWKCYAFGGRVELLMQRDPNDSRRPPDFRFKWYDRDGQDLGPVRADRHDPSMPPAADHAKLVEAAETIASEVPGPFVRIDLFAAGDRVVFGELTPHPGGDQRFADGLDELLGAAWERAEAALLARSYDTPHPG